MLNPIILQPERKDKRSKNSAAAPEFSTEIYGHSLDTSTPRPSVGLLVGRLLIRMGQKLAKEDVDLKISRENA